MLNKIRRWFKTRPTESLSDDDQVVFTRLEVMTLLADAKAIAYNDGKRDGLAIARKQATSSLQAILKEQNK